ncbi:hypothetical protein ACFZAR_20635 [Streptomyces sp. NPDC008222]
MQGQRGLVGEVGGGGGVVAGGAALLGQLDAVDPGRVSCSTS